MPEYSGSLPSFELAVALWLAPLLPLVAALYAAIGGYVAGADDRDLPQGFRPRVVGLLMSLAALGLVAFHFVVLLGLPKEQRQLVSHAWGMLRIGSLDTSFTFVGDPTTLSVAFAISAAAAAALWLAEAAGREQERKLASGVGLALGGGLMAALGDDLPMMIGGSLLTGLGALVLASGEDARRAARGFVVARAGDAALAGLAIVLLWGLAGGWIGREYVPDFRARLVAVQLGEPPPQEKGRAVKDAFGSISMAALPGSTLVIGGADLCSADADGKRGGVGTSVRPCREVARTPFARLPLPVALHDIEVRTGPGTHDLLVEKTRISTGLDTLITVAGATTVVREIRDQLAVRDGSGAHPLRAALGKRKIFDQPLLGVAGALLALFVALRTLSLAASFSARAAARSGAVPLCALAAGAELAMGAVVLLRLDFLFSFVPGTSAALAALAGLASVYAAAKASHGFELRESVALMAVANASLATVAAAFGAHAAAVVGLVSGMLGLLAFSLALGPAETNDLRELAGRLSARPRGVQLGALALSGAPLPAVGVFWARDGALAAAASSATSLGYAALALAALATGLVAFAAWRLAFLVTTGGKKKTEGTSRMDTAALAAGALGVLFGAAAHAHAVVGDVLPRGLETWLASVAEVDARGVPLDKGVRVGIAAACAVLAMAGVQLARSRYGSARDEGWAKLEPSRLLAAQLTSTRELFDPVLVEPALAVGRAVQRFDASFESLVFGGDAGLEQSPPPEEEPPAVSRAQKKRRRANEEEDS